MDDKDRLILGDPLGRVLKAGGEIFFIVRPEATLGCCAFLPLENQSWELAKMAVAREHRGCGIGRRLLHHVVEYAKVTGAHKLSLKTSSLLQPAIHTSLWAFKLSRRKTPNFRGTRGLMYLWNLFSSERKSGRLIECERSQLLRPARLAHRESFLRQKLNRYRERPLLC